MKKTLLAMTFSFLSAAAFAAEDFTLKLGGVNAIYEELVDFNNIGSDFFGDDPNKEVTLNNGDMLNQAQANARNWTIIRDAGGFNEDTFGDISNADPLESLSLTRANPAPGELPLYFETNLAQDPGQNDPALFVDFMLVLEETEIDGYTTYHIVEEFSFFDILTQDGATDWGLGIDTIIGNGDELITFGEGTLSASLSGKVFDADGTNNLPAGVIVDEDAIIDIQIGFSEGTFTDSGADLGNGDTLTSGTGTVSFPGQIPEPATLGIFGLALAGMGVMQRRRNKNA